MEVTDFGSMSIDELWSLHEKLATTLAARLASEKALLEARQGELNANQAKRVQKLLGKLG